MNSIIVYFFMTWAFRHIFNGIFNSLNLSNKTFIATNILAFLCSAFIIASFNTYPSKDPYDFGVYLKVAMLFLAFPQIVWFSCDNIKRAIYKARKMGKGVHKKLDRLINQVCTTLLISSLCGMGMYFLQFGKIGGPNYYADLYRLGLTGGLTWTPFVLQNVYVWAAFYIPFIVLGIYRFIDYKLAKPEEAPAKKQSTPKKKKAASKKK